MSFSLTSPFFELLLSFLNNKPLDDDFTTSAPPPLNTSELFLELEDGDEAEEGEEDGNPVELCWGWRFLW